MISGGEGKGPKKAESERVYRKYPRDKRQGGRGETAVEIHAPSPLQIREESALTLPVRLGSRYTAWTGMNECCTQHSANLSVLWSMV